MKARPLHDRVVVRRRPEADMTPGGIIIPGNAKEKPIEGEVLAVGPGRFLQDGTVAPLAVNVGDKILFGKYSGTEIKLEGEEYLIIREDDILVIFGQ